ncbi:HEAT repeat domain-containing protein [Tengunoibacter tsumagoiensis]|uniref:HEAT repeat-containing PBS lyase n=1 Tax=Tengunoibacter tsumagoiensis TaxID=2014871 RepID=A0A401ZZJ8_9CHLR|nr:HEAT repeat domain-containing protein [Tengunoibacter tsumagoiensis]GCE12266.1 hypothetical protein KTT_21250 [Tengunoibacter tsumagoiensis]
MEPVVSLTRILQDTTLDKQGRLEAVRALLQALTPLFDQQNGETELTHFFHTLPRADSQNFIELLILFSLEDSHKPLRLQQRWPQKVLSMLYEWVQPECLINALNNTNLDRRMAISLLKLIHDDECIQLMIDIAQDPAQNREMRTKAIWALDALEVNLPLKYAIEATRWHIYEGTEGVIICTVRRLAQQAPIDQLLPLLREEDNRLQSGAVKALMSIAKYIPLDTVLPLLKEDRHSVRKAALHILAAMGERTPFEIFTQLLRDPQQDTKMRQDAVYALNESTQPEAINILLEAAIKEKDPQVKIMALWVIANDDTEKSVPRLKAFLRSSPPFPLDSLIDLLNDSDQDVIKQTIVVLGILGSLEVAIPIDLLVSFLNNEDESIARKAALALCKLGSSAPVDKLLAALYAEKEETESEGTVHTYILEALSTLGKHIPLDALIPVLSADNQNEDRDRDSQEIDTSTLQNLARSLPEQIIQHFHNDRRASMRWMVLQAIEKSKAHEWLPLVIETLADTDNTSLEYTNSGRFSPDSIHDAAISALGALNAYSPIEPLLQLLPTSKEKFSFTQDDRISVLKALRQFGSRAPLTVLLPLLGSSDEHVCRLAFEHIQAIYPDALAELTPQLKTIARGGPVQGPFVSRRQYKIAETVALMQRADPSTLEMVIELLDHPFWEVRARAAKTLGTVQQPIPDYAIQRLSALCNDPESQNVQLTALTALNGILSSQ